MYSHLHIHTSIGSQLDGIGTSEQYAKLAKEKGQTALAITDHGKMSGHYDHYIACKKYGIKPIFGVEAYVEFLLERKEKNKRIRNKNMHLILLAKNEIGYKNLLNLNFISNFDEKHYYYRNQLKIDEIFNHKEGLMIGTACMGSPFARLYREKGPESSEKLFKLFVDELKDNFYVEVQINEITHKIDNFEKGQISVNEWMISLAKKYNVPIALTGDVHYPEPGLDKIQTLAIAISRGVTLDELDWELEGKSLFFMDENDYKRFNKEWGYNYTDKEIEEWCNNTQIIADQCNYELKERNRMLIPSLTDDDNKMLVEESRKGLMKKLKVNTWKDVPKEYKDRLNKELEIIVRKGFSSYFTILWDIFNFIEEENIMRGPARGSAAGSLIAYALNISTLDPLKYGLIFERFLSDQRSVDMVYDWFGEAV